jgi:cation transport ATPase
VHSSYTVFSYGLLNVPRVSSCSGPLSKAASVMEGVELATVSLVSNSMTVRYNPDQVTIEDITMTVQGCGFEVSESTTRELMNKTAPNPFERVVQIQFQGMFCKCVYRFSSAAIITDVFFVQRMPFPSCRSFV